MSEPTPEQIALRYLACLQSESIRLFGDKSGKLADLIAKTERQVGSVCMARATHPGEPERTPTGWLAKLDEYHDEQARKNFSLKRHPGQMVLHYLTAITAHDGDLVAAIKDTADAFGFEKPESCHRQLKRIKKETPGMKSLPMPNLWKTESEIDGTNI